MIPDFKWYSSESKRLGLPPRCPFASVQACPRYYQSLSLLGEAGRTQIPKEEDENLAAVWKRHPLWPKMGEQTTGIGYFDNIPKMFSNFCPEVAYDTFRYFASHLSRYSDELDSEMASERLAQEKAASNDPRWSWASVAPLHFSECPLFSPLSHGWPKQFQQIQAAGRKETTGAIFDVFISHASEDKDSFVRPLAARLTALGLRVWYDEFTLTLGDSLRAKIDEGLATSRYGVVVLSHDFFAKPWPQAELDGLFAREIHQGKIILPIWHNISSEEVVKYSPLLSGKLAALTAEGVEAIADKICAIIRPNAAPIRRARVTSKSGVRDQKDDRFQLELGKRHRQLREKILNIPVRRMADFYGFEKASELELFERGEDEFPTRLMRKLEDFFFVSKQHLEEGAQEIFQSFDIVSSSDDCARFLTDGFSPWVLTDRNDRHDLTCYIAFQKQEGGFYRFITSQTHGYFRSMGGGKQNIMNLIDAITVEGIDPYSVMVASVDAKVWKAIEQKRFYCNADRVGQLDSLSRDIFLKWCHE